MPKATKSSSPAPQKSTKSVRQAQPLRALHRSFKQRAHNYLGRRPHRSFRRTHQRFYARSLRLPGYWAFARDVTRMLWEQRRLFGLLVVVYAVLSGVMVGIASQAVYQQLGDALQHSSGDVFSGNWGEVGKAGLLLITTITGGASITPSEAQQIYSGILLLLTWLTTIWLLRNGLAGHAVRLRDGLYNAGAPFLSPFLVGLVFVVQLLPLALALHGYSAAVGSGLLDGGVIAMIFWFIAALLATLSLYWVTSTFIALVVVTLPGMYPFQAIKTAGDLVVGRRLRILLRLLWAAVLLLLTWSLIMIPLILIDAWVKEIWPVVVSVPVIPVSLLLLSSLTTVWLASYVYMLYRKVVEDDAQPV